MSLVVEDGSGLTNAESYISVADADARHTAFNNAAWTGTDIAKEAALRRATAYMEQAYRDRWHGHRHHVSQALSWPRNSVVVDEYIVITTTVVPADVANACAELALKALSSDLNADLTQQIVSEKVGPIETEYDRSSPQQVRFRAIDMMLQPYLRGSAASAKLVRA